MEIPQRALIIRETARVEHLDPGGVVAIEGSHIIWTPDTRCIGRRIKPQANVIGMDRRCDRGILAAGSRVFLVHRLRHYSLTGRDDEGLDAEPADKIPDTASVDIGLDVALIPRQTKRFIWHLNDKEVIVGLWPQPKHLRMEVFNRAQVTYHYSS